MWLLACKQQLQAGQWDLMDIFKSTAPAYLIVVFDEGKLVTLWNLPRRHTGKYTIPRQSPAFGSAKKKVIRAAI